MGDWPPTSGSRIEVAGANTATSGGTTVTSGAANTKGSWTELIASTPFECDALIVTANFAVTSCLLDIGVGAAGSETVLIPDILSSSLLANLQTQIRFPVRVPAGARLAARCAAVAAAANVTTVVHLVRGGFDAQTPRNLVKAYGVDATDSGGTSIDPGGTANTKGAWTQVVASTTAAAKELIIAVGNQNNSTATAANFLFDIGVGAAASEEILIPNYRIVASVNETLIPGASPAFPVSIPEGSRLAARSQSSTTDATDRLLDIVLYGIT